MNNIQPVLSNWPSEARQVANQVIKKYGQPHQLTDSELIWNNVGQWYKTVVSKKMTAHHFPMPHTDLVEQFIHYDVPASKVSSIVEFDGSVTVKRTEGLVSARCHDEEANYLALNLTHDIIKEKLTVEQAKQEYLEALIDFRKK